MGRKTAIIIILLLALQTFFILVIGIHLTKIENSLNPNVTGIKGLTPKHLIELNCEPGFPNLHGNTLKCTGRID